MNLDDFPRIPLGHLPTPLEPMDSLADLLGGPRLFVKRDDQTGLATGGNKTRKLEFLMADALAKGADTVVTEGATQSNHVRQTAAAAAKLGLACHVVLETVITEDVDYENNGNILLDRLLGATLHPRPPSDNFDAVAREFAADLERKNGKAPYYIPAGGSTPLGALGYTVCALELTAQMREMDVAVTHIVHATGSQGTQAGLLVGLEEAAPEINVHGITVSRGGDEQAEKVRALTDATAGLVGLTGGVPGEKIICDGGYFAPGYGKPNDAMIEALTLTARHEGLLLDPVYSGKAMAGLIGKIRAGEFTKDDTVVFLHTGGSAALFAYKSLFMKI